MIDIILFFSVFPPTIHFFSFFFHTIPSLPFIFSSENCNPLLKLLTIVTSLISNCFIRREKYSFVVTSLNLIDQNKMKNSMLRLSKSLLVTAILSKCVYPKHILQFFHYLYLYYYFGNQPSFSSCFFQSFRCSSFRLLFCVFSFSRVFLESLANFLRFHSCYPRQVWPVPE